MFWFWLDSRNCKLFFLFLSLTVWLFSFSRVLVWMMHKGEREELKSTISERILPKPLKTGAFPPKQGRRDLGTCGLSLFPMSFHWKRPGWQVSVPARDVFTLVASLLCVTEVTANHTSVCKLQALPLSQDSLVLTSWGSLCSSIEGVSQVHRECWKQPWQGSLYEWLCFCLVKSF